VVQLVLTQAGSRGCGVQLADTAGLLVVGQTTQRMAAPSARTYVGSGKVDEMAADCKRLDVDMVIFDDELSASQGRNIERILDAYCPGGVRVRLSPTPE
jgi:50S ribosomal subunit-associated GTPase HflX